MLDSSTPVFSDCDGVVRNWVLRNFTDRGHIFKGRLAYERVILSQAVFPTDANVCSIEWVRAHQTLAIEDEEVAENRWGNDLPDKACKEEAGKIRKTLEKADVSAAVAKGQ